MENFKKYNDKIQDLAKEGREMLRKLLSERRIENIHFRPYAEADLIDDYYFYDLDERYGYPNAMHLINIVVKNDAKEDADVALVFRTEGMKKTQWPLSYCSVKDLHYIGSSLEAIFALVDCDEVSLLKNDDVFDNDKEEKEEEPK